MSRYPEVCLSFIPCIYVHSSCVFSQMKAGTGTTTTDTFPIQRRIHVTNRTTPKILSHIPNIINNVLFQRGTGYPPHDQEYLPIELFTYPPVGPTLTQRHTGNLPHQFTTKDTLRPLLVILLT